MKRSWPLVLVTLVWGCAHLDYVGESYAPTSHVDVYYSEQNVPRPYTAIGEVIATGDMLVSTDKLQQKIRDEARKHGADAVVLTSLEQVQSGENSSWSENQTEAKNKKGGTTTTTTGSSSSSVEEKKKIRALFIRYKPAGEAAPAEKTP